MKSVAEEITTKVKTLLMQEFYLEMNAFSAVNVAKTNLMREWTKFSNTEVSCQTILYRSLRSWRIKSVPTSTQFHSRRYADKGLSQRRQSLFDSSSHTTLTMTRTAFILKQVSLPLSSLHFEVYRLRELPFLMPQPLRGWDLA